MKTRDLLIGAIALYAFSKLSSASTPQRSVSETSSGGGSVSGGYSTFPFFEPAKTETYSVINPIQPSDATPKTTTYTTPQQTYKIEVITQQATSKTTGERWIENKLSTSSNNVVKEMSNAGMSGPVKINDKQFVWIPAPGTPAYNALNDPNTIVPVYTYK